MSNKWFVIVNPTSGNGAAKKKWLPIYNELINQGFEFEFSFTKYDKHAVKLVQKSIKKGFKKFISIGGDGTLHNIVNGILSLNSLNISEIIIGIIPIGTGNDWGKTYDISKDYKKAIQIIKNKNIIKQDIGKITIKETKKVIYFNIIAGIGFDGFVVYKANKYKNFGFLTYLIAALVSITSYKKSTLKITFNNIVLKEKTLMLLIGICKFTGGGMQLTKNANTRDGLFDISHISKFNLFNILVNIPNLFNGKITSHKLVNTYKTSNLKVKVLDSENAYIQADGEIIGSGSFSISLLEKAINFIIP